MLLGLLSCSILCINYSASPRPLCGSGGVSVGWIGLSEAEVRPALLIIRRAKYSPTAMATTVKKRQVDERMRVEGGTGV